MLAFRDILNEAHVALLYLLVVQIASARAGRGLGFVVAALSFLGFDWFFLPPYGTLVVAKAVDWAVLAAFLATSLVAAQLFQRIRAEVATSKLRAAELDRLSLLGAETLNAGRADDAIAAIAGVIHSALRLDRCAVYVRSGEDMLRAACMIPQQDPQRERSGYDDSLKQVLASGAPLVIRSAGVIDILPRGVELVDQAIAPDARELMLPLAIRGYTVGVLSVGRSEGLIRDESQRRFLDVLSYYAALGVERVNLEANSEHADALREAARLKDAVLASVSHDLRTPLTTIKALAHDLAAEGDERATTIEEEADRLNAMVADLLDLSRLNSGAMALDAGLNEAEDLIGAVLQRIGGASKGREIRVSFDPGEPLLIGRFDFAQTLRLMVNIVENAIKYSPVTEPVDLAARREADWLVFSVADRGKGIAPEEADRIFEPFYRLPGAAPDVGGAGLGLSISRGLAEAQGGTLTYSPREGGGSVFTLRVPAMDLAEVARL